MMRLSPPAMPSAAGARQHRHAGRAAHGACLPRPRRQSAKIGQLNISPDLLREMMSAKNEAR